MPVCCNPFRVSASVLTVFGGENPVGFNPNGVSDTLEPAEPVTANPGMVNSRRVGQQTERRSRLRRGHQRRLRTRGRQRLQRS